MFSTSNPHRDLTRLTTTVPSRRRVASIAGDDPLILLHRPNLGSNFREHSSQTRRLLRSPAPFSDYVLATLNRSISTNVSFTGRPVVPTGRCGIRGASAPRLVLKRPRGDKCSKQGKPSQANRGPKNLGRSDAEMPRNTSRASSIGRSSWAL